MINQIKYIWDFKSLKQKRISIKIADGRNYYNHHTQQIKQLSNDELFRFSYFLEDIILGYIYNKIGVSTKTIKEKLQHNFYYDKKQLK
jgi:hypothetical protein